MRGSAAALMLALALVAPTAGHHGRGSSNVPESSTLTGTVERAFRRNGSHPTMRVRVDRQVWVITIGPGLATTDLGDANVPLGATVTVRGYRNKDAKRFEFWADHVTWGDRIFEL